MDVNNFPVVDKAGALRSLRIAIKTRRPTIILGPPGYAKTALAEMLAREMYPEHGSAYFRPAGSPPEESDGIPSREGNGQIVRHLIGPYFKACSVPCLLIVDEVTRCDARQQGALMTVTNERRVGDFRLHPDTAVVLLGNEPDSGGTFNLLDALLNRCHVVVYRPEASEFIAWAPENIGADGSILRDLVRDYCATAGIRTELITLPPPGFSESGALWPSWRSIEVGLTRVAALLEDEPSAPEDALFTELAGCIGKSAAAGYLAARRLRENLPTPAEIEASPTTAKLPANFEAAVSALGLLDKVARTNPEAAWLYASRFTPANGLGDVGGALARQLRTRPPVNKAHPLHAEAWASYMTVQGNAAKLAQRAAL